MGSNPSGWLIIDKPIGMTSTKVVSIVRRLLNTKKVGHAGTLDPFASGVLPIAVGEATKTVAYAQQNIKEYQFTLSFGETRDTEDIEGAVIATSLVTPKREEILAALPSFIGEVDQVPPRYSAIKIEGKRSYTLARAGSQHEMVSRKIMIHTIDLLAIDSDARTATFSVLCGKGTYIRAIARDLAAKLGACGYVSMLRRMRVGDFSLERGILLANLEEMVHNQPPNDYLLSVDAVLDDIPVCSVPPVISECIRHGQQVSVDLLLQDIAGFSGVIRVMSEGQLIALATLQDGYIKPIRVFNH